MSLKSEAKLGYKERTLVPACVSPAATARDMLGWLAINLMSSAPVKPEAPTMPTRSVALLDIHSRLQVTAHNAYLFITLNIYS